MSSVASTDPEESRARRRAVNEIVDSMRELAVQMTVLNVRAGERLGLRDVDLKALDILMRGGAATASALGRRLGMHPATMTGILDRLEKGGWIVRERDPDDRRAVRVRAAHPKVGEVVQLFMGINAEMNGVFERYDQHQLETLIDFIRSATDASKRAGEQLGEEE
jgi:DNA-binding MarR family transcriptional regulator